MAWSLHRSRICSLLILCLLFARCLRYRDKLHLSLSWPLRSRFANRGWCASCEGPTEACLGPGKQKGPLAQGTVLE